MTEISHGLTRLSRTEHDEREVFVRQQISDPQPLKVLERWFEVIEQDRTPLSIESIGLSKILFHDYGLYIIMPRADLNAGLIAGPRRFLA